MKNVFAVPEIDHLTLMQSLSGYAYPRDKVTRLLRSKELISIKRGLYVTNDQRDWYSREVMANLIYGPSYISLEFALRHHNLIPEAVETVTSVTTRRNRSYDTAIGRFEYEYLSERWFAPGMTFVPIDARRGFLIAGPEKAIVDTLYLRAPDIGPKDLEAHLFENLRIDSAEFEGLDFSAVAPILDRCPRSSVRALAGFLKRKSSG